MRAGKLNRRITIQKAVITNTLGDIAETWGTYKTVWASIEPLRGREYFEGDAENAKVTHRIRTRYYPGVKQSMRIVYKKRIFDIVSVMNREEKNIELEFMCEERIV